MRVSGVPSDHELGCAVERSSSGRRAPRRGPARTRDRLLYRPEPEVYNLHHNAASVAELAVALVLAASKGLLPMDRSLRSHDWRPRYGPDPAISLSGGHAVVGQGSIGSRVAAAPTGLGLKVVGVRRRPTCAGEVVLTLWIRCSAGPAWWWCVRR